MNQLKKFKYIISIPDEEDFELKHAPIGWEENTIQWARSEQYYGMVRNFSFPLKYVKEGAKKLRSILYRHGINALASLKILMLNPETWDYDEVYQGDIDFSTIEDDIVSFSVGIADNNIEAKIKAKEDVVFEIPIEESEAVKVNMISIPDSANASILFAHTGLSPTPPWSTFDAEIGDSNVDSNILELKPASAEYYSNFSDLSTSDNWFAMAKVLIQEVTISGNLVIDIRTGVPQFVSQLRLVDDSGRSLGWSYTITNNSPTLIPVNAVFTLYQNSKVFLLAETAFVGITSIRFSLLTSTLNISYTREIPSTQAWGYRPYTLYKKLMQKIVGQDVTPVSYILENTWKDLIITSGAAIRNLPNATIKTNFKDFFKSLDSVLCLGFSVVSGVPTLESREYFFQEVLETTNIGDVKDCTIEVATQFLYNSVKIGYPEKDYERPDGIEEYNGTQEYSSSLTRISKKYDAVSKYRADMFGIEAVRKDQERMNLEKEDAKEDNDIYFIKIKDIGAGGAYNIETGSDFSWVSGISFVNSAYNLAITPKQNLKRHARFLSASLEEDGVFDFQSASKNKDLRTLKDGEMVSESSALQYEKPLFLPYIAKFTTYFKPENLQDFNSKTNGYIRFKAFGQELTGYVLETSVDFSKNSAQEYKVLLTTRNDLTKIIR